MTAFAVPPTPVIVVVPPTPRTVLLVELNAFAGVIEVVPNVPVHFSV